MDKSVFKYRIVLFYFFTFAISWLSWFLMSRVYQGGQLTPIVYVFSTIGGLGPLLALLILQGLSGKLISVKQILSQIRIRKGNTAWFLASIFALPIITIASNIGYYFMGKEPLLRLIKSGPDTLGLMVLPIMAIHFATSLITSPLFEEPGWRGFALGILQTKFGRDIGSLIVGLMWWIWHQPMNLTFGIQPSIYSALSMILLSFMIDSLFNLSEKNLFTAMLAHQSSGTVIAFLYQGTNNLLQLCLLLGFLILLRMREGKSRNMLSPA
jgi:uncharacterized protein